MPESSAQQYPDANVKIAFVCRAYQAQQNGYPGWLFYPVAEGKFVPGCYGAKVDSKYVSGCLGAKADSKFLSGS